MTSEDRVAIDRLVLIARGQGWDKIEEKIIDNFVIVTLRKPLSEAARKAAEEARRAMPGPG